MAREDEDIFAMAGQQTPAPEGDDSDIYEIAGATPPAPRSAGRSFLARTVGRLPGALDRALGGLPSTAAGVAGAYSADDEAGVTEALEEGGGTSSRLLNVLLGAAELGLTAKYPAQAAQAGGVGALAERATGDETTGDVAEIGTGVAQGVKTLATGAVRGAKRLFGGETSEQMVTKGLGAERTAQDVGQELQLPPRPDRAGGPRASQAQKAITRTADEASDLYNQAGAQARAAGARVPASDRSILKAARAAQREAKQLQRPLTGGASRAVKAIVRLGRGQKSKLLGPGGKPLSSAGRDMGVDELIEAQSTLRREINNLAKDDPARRPLIGLSKSIDDAMAKASAGTKVGDTLSQASDVYRRKTIPTRTTAARLQAAETPEQSARMVTGPKTPSRFERMTEAVPESAEGLRSSAFNDMVQGSMKGGKLDMRRLADKLDSAESSGQLKNLGNTKARQLTVRAIRKAAAGQRAGEQAPVGGLGVGAATGTMGGPIGSVLGLGTGYAIGKLVQAGMTSERAGRALFRLASARRGTPGWKSALKVLESAMNVAGPTARAGIGVAQEE